MRGESITRDGSAEGRRPQLRLAELMRAARSVVALTGAGASVPSGIPDFRSPGTGLWERVDPMEVAHIDAFRNDPERFWRFYRARFALLEGKRPNEVHRALATLESEGMLDAVITQNIDMLHRKAGTRELIEVHGSIERCSCPACRAHVTLAEASARLASDERGVPRCERCGVPLKPDVVLFGEMLPAGAMARARELCTSADLLLCIGSSLEVHPVADLPLLTLEAGGAVAILTRGATPLDALAEVRLHGDLVEELRALLLALGVR
jgi:NAD-dependent protein deacetylase/lipoamidase